MSRFVGYGVTGCYPESLYDTPGPAILRRGNWRVPSNDDADPQLPPALGSAWSSTSKIACAGLPAFAASAAVILEKS